MTTPITRPEHPTEPAPTPAASSSDEEGGRGAVMMRWLRSIELHRPRASATRPSPHSPRSFGVVVGGRVGRALAVVGHLPKRPRRPRHP